MTIVRVGDTQADLSVTTLAELNAGVAALIAADVPLARFDLPTAEALRMYGTAFVETSRRLDASVMTLDLVYVPEVLLFHAMTPLLPSAGYLETVVVQRVSIIMCACVCVLDGELQHAPSKGMGFVYVVFPDQVYGQAEAAGDALCGDGAQAGGEGVSFERLCWRCDAARKRVLGCRMTAATGPRRVPDLWPTRPWFDRHPECTP